MDFDLIQTILSLLGGGGLIGGGTLLLNKFTNRINVKLIKNIDDPDIDDFIELYEEVLDENIRITPDEIKRFVGNHLKIKSDTLCDFLFICKQGKELIGFLKVIYCNKTKILFIAYLGIDKKHNKARNIATNALLNHLSKYISSKLCECKAIFFEVEMPSDYTKKSKAMGRLRLFKSVSERLMFNCYQLEINYIQPEMPKDVGSTNEETTKLLFIPRDKKRITQIEKEELLKYLEFIYLKIYGRTYDDQELHQLYAMYLKDLLLKYENELPPKINLK